MQQQLAAELHKYLVENNPDVLISLQGERIVTKYIEDKIMVVQPTIGRLLEANTPSYITQQVCMDELTADLRPSRYSYVVGILQDEFEKEYEQLRESGMLTYEVINILAVCKDEFDTFQFSETNKDDQYIRYCIIGAIAGYFAGDTKRKITTSFKR